MNILVSGGAGFIGSHIVDAYISLGHNVTIIDNLSAGFEEFVNPKAKFYNADVRDENIGKRIQKNKIEIINHHAAKINLRQSVIDPVSDAEVNLLGSVEFIPKGV